MESEGIDPPTSRTFAGAAKRALYHLSYDPMRTAFAFKAVLLSFMPMKAFTCTSPIGAHAPRVSGRRSRRSRKGAQPTWTLSRAGGQVHASMRCM